MDKRIETLMQQFDRTRSNGLCALVQGDFNASRHWIRLTVLRQRQLATELRKNFKVGIG